MPICCSAARFGLLSLLTIALISTTFPLVAGKQFDIFSPTCSTTENYTSGSSYEKNLENLLSALPKQAAKNEGYASYTVGAPPNQVFGLIMCYLENSWDACLSCLSDATNGAPQVCPYSKNVSAFDDTCVIRYANAPLAMHDGPPDVIIPSQTTTTNRDFGIPQLDDFLQQVNDMAASSPQRYARNNVSYNSTHWVYVLSQCTRDLSTDVCKQCLNDYTILSSDNNTILVGLFVQRYSCFLDYQVAQTNVLLPSQLPPPSPPPPPSGEFSAVITFSSFLDYDTFFIQPVMSACLPMCSFFLRRD